MGCPPTLPIHLLSSACSDAEVHWILGALKFEWGTVYPKLSLYVYLTKKLELTAILSNDWTFFLIG